MEHNGIVKAGVAPHDASLRRRLLNKLVIDVLPAALTSVIGGFLVTQYQFNHSVVFHPIAEQAAPASAEMIKLVRDEHGAIMDYLKVQIAAEKARNSAADDADARAVADAKLATDKAAADKLAAEVLAATSAKSAPAASSMPAVVVTAKAATPRRAVAVAAAAPLVVAQAAPDVAATPVAQPAPPPQQPKSLLAKTLDIKDHVVAVTSHAAWTAVTAVGSLPSWIASMGDRGGDTTTVPSPGGQSFTS
jgi:hypothetical protein